MLSTLWTWRGETETRQVLHLLHVGRLVLSPITTVVVSPTNLPKALELLEAMRSLVWSVESRGLTAHP